MTEPTTYILLIDDDEDDLEMISAGLELKGLNVKTFDSSAKALSYLTLLSTHSNLPSLIILDINMPKLNGFELRNKVFTDKQLQSKCIPYLFFTTTADKKSVMEAYSLSVQGFFVKPTSINAIENTIRKIVEYWQECIAPNQF